MTILSQQTFTHRTHVKRVEEEVRSLLLGADSFRSAITRERKRTERSGLAIVLVMINIGDFGQDSHSLEIWNGVAAGLSAVKSEIDIVGWFEQGAVMGLLTLDVQTSELASVCKEVETKIRKELTGRFEPHMTENVSLRLRVYPEPIRSEEEASRSIDSVVAFPNARAVILAHQLDRPISHG